MIIFATHFQIIDETSTAFNLELLKLMFQSAEFFHPGCKKVILTDRKSNFEGISCEIIRYPIDNYPLRYAETLAEAHFLKNFKEEANLVFLDFDVLIQSNLESVFESDADLFLTLRSYPTIPINLGVSFIKKSGQERVFQFLNKVLAKMLLYETAYLKWWGSQKAIFELLQKDLIAMDKKTDMLRRDDLTIKFLNADLYNYASEEMTHSFMPEKKILHFKGKYKKAMPLYFEKIIQSLFIKDNKD